MRKNVFMAITIIVGGIFLASLILVDAHPPDIQDIIIDERNEIVNKTIESSNAIKDLPTSFLP